MRKKDTGYYPIGKSECPLPVVWLITGIRFIWLRICKHFGIGILKVSFIYAVL